MIDIFVAPEVGIIMEGSLKDKELSFQFFVSFFFLISTTSRGFKKAGILPLRRLSSWPTSILHLRTQSFPCDSRQESSVNQTSAGILDFVSTFWKKSLIYRNTSYCIQARCPLTVNASSERSVWNLATKTVYFVLTFLRRTAPCKKKRDRL